MCECVCVCGGGGGGGGVECAGWREGRDGDSGIVNRVPALHVHVLFFSFRLTVS